MLEYILLAYLAYSASKINKTFLGFFDTQDLFIKDSNVTLVKKHFLFKRPDDKLHKRQSKDDVGSFIQNHCNKQYKIDRSNYRTLLFFTLRPF